MTTDEVRTILLDCLLQTGNRSMTYETALQTLTEIDRDAIVVDEFYDDLIIHLDAVIKSFQDVINSTE